MIETYARSHPNRSTGNRINQTTSFRESILAIVRNRQRSGTETRGKNELRRKTLNLFELERQSNFPKQEKAINKTDHQYPENFLDYKGNVLNQKAISFYERHGVKMIENAFEIQNDFTNKEIMVTKQCIKYQMGLCPTHGEPETKVEEPLYLADNNRKYKLEFDCKQCAMKVIFLQ